MTHREPRLGSHIRFFLLGLWLALYPLGTVPLYAQSAPRTALAGTWQITEVARVGQDGFTQLAAGRAGPNGSVVVYGERNGKTGIFLIKNGAVTEVVTEGTVLSGDLGKLGDVGAFSFQFAPLPNGDVLFPARATEGTLSPAFLYTFRWRAGTISLVDPSEEFDPETFTQAFGHDLSQVTADSRWLAVIRTGGSPTSTAAYELTDGENRQPLVSVNSTGANCVFDTTQMAAVNSAGVLAYYQVLQTTPQDGVRCANEQGTTRTWSVKLGGAATGTLADGEEFEQVNTRTGSALSTSGLFLFNDNGQLAAIRELYNSPAEFITRQQVVILSQDGEVVVQDTNGPASSLFLADLDADGGVLYSALLDDNVTTVFAAGPDLEADRIVRTGDPLFGSTVASLGWVARPAEVGGGAVAFVFGLENGTTGIAVAQQQTTRWVNPAGGAWGTATNWSPVAVPGDAAAVNFDLDATYTVDVGTRRAGNVAVRGGSVRLRNAELEVADAGAISVQGATAGEIARLTIGQNGDPADATTVAANIRVGVDFPGELRIENALVESRPDVEGSDNVVVGFVGPATATVTGGAEWFWSTLQLGVAAASTLRIEDGAQVGRLGKELWIGGKLPDLPVVNQTAAVVVDNITDNEGRVGGGTILGGLTLLTVGESLIGKLDITNGGRARAVTTHVGTRDHGSRTDGSLTVDGTNPTRPSHLEAGNGSGEGGLFAATGLRTDALITVSGGGVISASHLALAVGPQSSALMFVDGMEAADAGNQRSRVIAPIPPFEFEQLDPEAGACVIGQAGRGTLNVSNGGLVQCRQIAVGLQGGSVGEVNIDGSLRVTPARMVATGPRIEDGTICIGRVPVCGATSGTVRGTVTLGTDGILEGGLVGVGPGGLLRGTGLVIVSDSVLAFGGGRIAPGLDILQASASAAQVSAATLTIQGNLMVSATGVITLDVLGGSVGERDRLVVSGTATVDGTLALNFGNGYAPRQGETLALIEAAALNGTPANVVITGLAEGFEYEFDGVAGDLRLVALNDGVPTTTAQRELFLPQVVK